MAFGNDCLSNRQAYRCYNTCIEGHQEARYESRVHTTEYIHYVKRRVQHAEFDIAKGWKLDDDNAPAHTSFVATNSRTNADVPTVSQSPYSPEVAFPTSFCFRHVKNSRQHQRGLYRGFKEHFGEVVFWILLMVCPDNFFSRVIDIILSGQALYKPFYNFLHYFDQLLCSLTILFNKIFSFTKMFYNALIRIYFCWIN